MKAWMSSNFGQIPPQTLELSALARLKKMIYNVVNTLTPTFSIGSSLFLQITRITIKSRTSIIFNQIRPWTVELAAFEPGKIPIYL